MSSSGGSGAPKVHGRVEHGHPLVDQHHVVPLAQLARQLLHVAVKLLHRSLLQGRPLADAFELAHRRVQFPLHRHGQRACGLLQLALHLVLAQRPLLVQQPQGEQQQGHQGEHLQGGQHPAQVEPGPLAGQPGGSERQGVGHGGRGNMLMRLYPLAPARPPWQSQKCPSKALHVVRVRGVWPGQWGACRFGARTTQPAGGSSAVGSGRLRA